MLTVRLFLPLCFAAVAVAALAATPLEGAPRPAPEFTLERLNGPGPIRLADYRGRSAVILLFWAPW